MKYLDPLVKSLIAVLILLVPTVSFAATVPSVQTSTTAQELSTELTQLNAELANGSTTLSSLFTLMPGQSTEQASTTMSGGLLEVSLPTFEHTNPIPSIFVQPITQLAKVTLQYMPCEAAAPSVCVTTASSTYPAVNADLASGQSTNYLNYKVTLTNLSTTTATFQVTESSLLSSIQNQINTIATQVKTLLGE